MTERERADAGGPANGRADGRPGEDDEPVGEIVIEEQEGEDLDAAMREAVAAVEQVENRSPAEAGAGEPLAGSTAELEALRREVAELRDRSMRTLADFDNFRKRAERERDELRRYAVLELVRDLVTVVDNLERALAAGGTVDDLKLGVELTLRHLLDLLRREGLREVAAGAGQPFDPAVHDAVSRHDDPEAREPTVTRELQRGWVLRDRLVRPAMVEVAVPAAPAGAGRPAGGDAGEEA
jgi:molecular chaperone GrpE